MIGRMSRLKLTRDGSPAGTLATAALSGTTAAGMLAGVGTTAAVLPAAGAPKFATRYARIGLMSSGFRDAPFSIIWRSVLRQPSSESRRAAMRSRLWQEEQAFTTTSLPLPSGSGPSAQKALVAARTKTQIAQCFIAFVAYNIHTFPALSEARNSAVNACANARRIHGFLSRVRRSCDRPTREIARRAARRSAAMTAVGRRISRANVTPKNADWRRG